MLGIYACAHEDFPVMRFRYFVADREPHSQSEECKVWSIDCSESMPVRMKMDSLMVVYSVRVRNSMWACTSTNSDIWGHALCLARFCPSASSNGKASLLETFCSTCSVSADILGSPLFCDVQDFPSQQEREREKKRKTRKRGNDVILRDEFRAFTLTQKLVLFFSFRVNRLIDWLESHTLLHRRDFELCDRFESGLNN